MARNNHPREPSAGPRVPQLGALCRLFRVTISYAQAHWDISVITCEAIGVPHFIGDEDEIDAGKFIGCNVCPAIPYEAYNPEEPYEP